MSTTYDELEALACIALAEVGVAAKYRPSLVPGSVLSWLKCPAHKKAVRLAIWKVEGPSASVRCDLHLQGEPCGRVTVADALLGRVCHLAGWP